MSSNMNNKIPRSGVTKKPVRSIEEQAESLVNEVDDITKKYCVQMAISPDPMEAAKDALAYGFLIAQLRYRSKDIVQEALKSFNLHNNIIGG